jgi:hypothetical protein
MGRPQGLRSLTNFSQGFCAVGTRLHSGKRLLDCFTPAITHYVGAVIGQWVMADEARIGVNPIDTNPPGSSSKPG